MTEVTMELNMARFSKRARQAFQTARARQERSPTMVLDTRWLLIGLAHDTSLWPPGMEDATRQLRDRPVVNRSTTEARRRRGEYTFQGAFLTEEVVAVVQDAIELADSYGSGDVLSEHLLFALSGTSVAEATALLRSLTGARDPWVATRRHLQPRLRGQEVPERLRRMEAGVRERRAEMGVEPPFERLAALFYILARDEVPFGKLTAIVQQLESSSHFEFTNTNAEALARELAQRLWVG